MDIPASIAISKKARDSFQTIKNRTGVTNNVLSRIAMMLAIKSGANLDTVVREDAGGQTLSRELMFGDHADMYDVFIRQYLHDFSVKMPVGMAIASLIEVGAHKMAHCRTLEDIGALFGSGDG